jgi:hypothetical protein
MRAEFVDTKEVIGNGEWRSSLEEKASRDSCKLQGVGFCDVWLGRVVCWRSDGLVAFGLGGADGAGRVLVSLPTLACERAVLSSREMADSSPRGLLLAV